MIDRLLSVQVSPMSYMRAATHSRQLSFTSVKTRSTMRNGPRRSCRLDVLRGSRTTSRPSCEVPPT